MRAQRLWRTHRAHSLDCRLGPAVGSRIWRAKRTVLDRRYLLICLFVFLALFVACMESRVTTITVLTLDVPHNTFPFVTRSYEHIIHNHTHAVINCYFSFVDDGEDRDWYTVSQRYQLSKRSDREKCKEETTKGQDASEARTGRCKTRYERKCELPRQKLRKGRGGGENGKSEGRSTGRVRIEEENTTDGRTCVRATYE